MRGNWAQWYWPLWLSVMTVTLMVPEVYALVDHGRWDNTLSNWVWDELQVTKSQQLPWTAAHYLVFGAWIVLGSWLTFHFFFRRFV